MSNRVTLGLYAGSFNPFTVVHLDILKQAMDPTIMAEMAASDGRDMSIIKQYVTRPTGRPTKKEDKE